MVEVAPADLAPERLAPRRQASRQTERAADLGRRAHAQAQVGGQARGRLLGDAVAPAPVVVGGLAHEGHQPPPRRGRARGDRRVAAGQPAQALRGQPRPLDRPRRGHVVRQGQVAPGPVEGREQAVPLARGAGHLVDVRDQVGGAARRADARLVEGRRHARVAVAGEGGDVPRVADAPGAGLGGDRRHHLLGPPVAHHQAAAARAQLLVERLEAGAQEAQPRRRAVVAAPEQGRVEHEQGDDRAGVDRRAQGRMVGHPQVAPEPDDRRRRGHASAVGTAARPSSTSRVRRWRSAKVVSSSRRTSSRSARRPARPPGSR